MSSPPPSRPSGAVAKSSGASAGLRKRTVGGSKGASKAGGSGLLRFYTEDTTGLKVGPTVVLVMSLLFIAFVILLHIWGRFHRG